MCYAHADTAVVYPILEFLQEQGVNTWFDGGIEAGVEWTDALAEAITGSSRVIFFASPNSASSEHCRRELVYAQDEARDIVAAHIATTDLPPGLRLALNNRQAILRDSLGEHEFLDRLLTAVAAPQQDRADIRAQTSQPISTQPRFRWFFWAAPLLVVASLVTWFLTGPTQTATTSDLIDNSIAVLPFSNHSTDPEHTFVAKGVHGTVLHELTRIQDLNIIARTTMDQYVDTTKTLATVARELRVKHVMEGTIEYFGEQMRLQVSLVDASTGATAWAEHFERPLADIFAVQREIAEQIANQLQVKMLSPPVDEITGSVSKEAIIFFMKARNITGNIRPGMPPQFYTFLDAALEEDPNFGLAHGLKAMGLALGLGYQPILEKALDEQEDIVIKHADAAIKFPDSAGYGYATKAMVAEQWRRWEEADRLWQLAILAAPNEFDILDDYARYMAFKGEAELAEAVLKRTHDLNPVDRQLDMALATWQGDLRSALAYVPDHQPTAKIMLLVALGEKEQATALLQQIPVAAVKAPLAFGVGCYYFSRVDLAEQAQPFCDGVKNLDPSVWPPPALRHANWLAAVATGDLDKVEQAMLDIENSGDMMGPIYIHFLINPFFDPVQNHPRIVTIRHRMGFKGPVREVKSSQVN